MQNYKGISTGFPSISKWLGDLRIPVDDIEIVGHEQVPFYIFMFFTLIYR